MGSVVYRQRHGKIGLGFLLEASRNDGSEVFSTQGKLQSYNQKRVVTRLGVMARVGMCSRALWASRDA